MNPNRRSYIVLAVMAVVLTLIFAFVLGRNNSYSWRPHFQPDSSDPYGMTVLLQLLEGYYPDYELHDLGTRYDSIPESSEPASYLFVGPSYHLDSASTHAIIRFVEAGNTALISTEQIDYRFFTRFFPEDCDEYVWPGLDSEYDTMAQVRLVDQRVWNNDTWDVQFRYDDELYAYEWTYLEGDVFCEAPVRRQDLGFVHGAKVNFIRLAYGNGYLLIHTTPLLFTNYFLKEREGLAYANGVFSYLPEGDIYWDRYALVNAGAMADSGPRAGQRSFGEDGPLSFILNNRALAWAWYLLLTGGLVFLLFRAKRRQRIIPVLEPNRNTSLEFIANIGRLYFLKPNHRKLALEQMQLFLQYVRNRYHLHGREPDAGFIKMLSVRSGVGQDRIEDIVNFHSRIQSSGWMTETSLTDFHRKLEYFYQHCK